MDEREGMSHSGSSPYYFNSGVSGSVPNSGSLFASLAAQPRLPSPPTAFKNFTNPNPVGFDINMGVGSGGMGSAQQVQNPLHLGHDINMGVASGNLAKKKRGRPRKYDPHGANMSLENKNRGRPKRPGSKQRLASLGEWMNNSAGTAFTPHVIHIEAGEDITSKILLFAQQRPRALCILSANGTVSTVTLRRSSLDTVTYEGQFQILFLSGSYLLSEEDGLHNRTGGLSVSVCSPDGHMIGGAVGGRLIASSLVQAIVCSFVYGDSKTRNSPDAEAKPDHDTDVQPTENFMPASGGPTEDIAPNLGMAGWPPNSWPGTRDPNTEINLTHG